MLFVALAVPLRALDPAKNLDQYNRQTWTRQSGLPVDVITAAAQTDDGYLWFGSNKGLVRFDGQRFERFDFAGAQKVRNINVTAIAAAPGGGLWVGFTNSGFGHFDGSTYKPAGTKEQGNEYLDVSRLRRAADGSIWLTGTHGVSRYDPATREYAVLPLNDDNIGYGAFGTRPDAHGNVWVATVNESVFRLGAGSRWQLDDPELKRNIAFDIAFDRDGDLWVGTNSGVRGYGPDLKHRHTLLSSEEVRAMLMDSHGALWIGGSRGLHRYHRGRLQTLNGDNGLAGGAITALAEDREGNLWVGTREGLSYLTDVKFPTLPVSPVPPAPEVIGIAPARNDGIWVAHPSGVAHVNGGLKNYSQDAGLPDAFFKRVFEASNGDVYVVAGMRHLAIMANGKVVATHELPKMVVGLAEDAEGVVASVGGDLYRVDRDRFVPYSFHGSPPAMGWIVNLMTSRDGAIWVSSVNGVFRIKDGEFRNWGVAEGLTDPGIVTLAEDSDGVIWAATFSGLARIKGDTARMIAREQGLFDTNIFGMAADDFGYLWIDGGRGIYRVERSQLNAVAEGRAPSVTCDVYDGPESVLGVDKSRQERIAAKSVDGCIWFASAKGVVRIDPGNVPRSTVAPLINIEQVTANGRRLETSGVALPVGRGELQFEYAGLTFIAPQKVRYRYRLVGYDAEWSEAGNRRMAVFGNLRPGTYEFEVTAANADGVWAPAPATFTVTLTPRFYQTAWFYAVCGVAAFAALGAVYAWRVRHLHRRALALQRNREQLEATVRERTAELRESNAALQNEIGVRTNAEAQLRVRTEMLEQEIEHRKRMQLEIERVHRELVIASRHAGMAEVATGVLHNVGNVLNSVNVSAALVIERMQRSKSTSVNKLADLLNEHAGNLAQFLTSDPKGQKVPAYLSTLAKHLEGERNTTLGELENLRKNISHINDIVAMQQNFAKAGGVIERIPIRDLVEDAIRINDAALQRHGVALVRDFQTDAVVTVDRHKVMQILVNVIRNAKYACDESGRNDKQLTIQLAAENSHIRISMLDNGVGIAPENLTRIFAHGFTTRKAGHGFGLHSSALAATEIGGALRARSAGLGHGAEFVLTFPVDAPANPAASAAAVVAQN